MKPALPSNPPPPSAAIARGWKWVPALYLAQGLPYVLVISVSTVMYKNLGMSNEEIGYYTSLFYLPWVLKPLWSPWIDQLRMNRRVFLSMQWIMGACLLLVGLTLTAPWYLAASLAAFWIAAFASATNDIASDGYYMEQLSEKEQSFFVGIRSTFYRISWIAGEGLLVMLAGGWISRYGDPFQAWSNTMTVSGMVVLLLALANTLLSPRGIAETRSSGTSAADPGDSYLTQLRTFFFRPGMGWALAFVLCYRLGEGLLLKMSAPFLLDSAAEGGMALTTAQLGEIKGTAGVIALSLGGILGGVLISRHGLGRWLLPMMLALNVPNLGYAALAWLGQADYLGIAAVVVLEQFGYGFGFSAFMVYLLYLSHGDHPTSHYALSTGVMALGLMIPGFLSGLIQSSLGYTDFFLVAVAASAPSFLLLTRLRYAVDFGKKIKH